MKRQFINSTTKRVAFAVSVLALALSLFVAGQETIFANNSSILQLSDLPDGFDVIEERYVSSTEVGKVDVLTDFGHPLTIANLTNLTATEQQRLFAYTNRQSFSAGKPGLALVMNFTYDYTSETEAKWAAQWLQDDFKRLGGLTPVNDPSVAKAAEASLHGEYYIGKGDDGNVCHWFFGYKGNTLVIFFVDGFDSQLIAETYQTVIGALSD